MVPEAKGSDRAVDVAEEYVDRLLQDWDGGDRQLQRRLGQRQRRRGRGAAAPAQELPGEHTVLNPAIDGRFPAHHPDPTIAKNQEQLIAAVRGQKADLGIGFDGDADRIGAVDDAGNMLLGDQLMVVLARDVLRERPGATIIADVKASQVLYDEIAKAGGKPLMFKTGHSLIKAKMAEIKAPFAGEMSGHIFYADRWYGFDDALYVAVRLLGIVARMPGKLSAVTAALPQWSTHRSCASTATTPASSRWSTRSRAGCGSRAQRQRHRRRARADPRRLVAAAGEQHASGAGRPRRGA